MAYDTWDWDKVTGSGKSGSFKPVRHDPICSQETEAGYIATSPEDVRGVWIFRITFDLLRPSSFIYVVNFLHAHRAVPFYLRWPFEMAGIPEEAYIAKPGGMAPWDSEVEPLAGEGPTDLVVCMTPDVAYERIRGRENYWRMDTIELRQV